jgi:hypothetical protein
MKKLSDAFYCKERPGKMLYMFWSKDWFSFRPWTYNLGPVKYFDRRVELRDIGTMTVKYFGPLCVVKYESKGY